MEKRCRSPATSKRHRFRCRSLWRDAGLWEKKTLNWSGAAAHRLPSCAAAVNADLNYRGLLSMVTSTVRKIEEKNDFLLVGARCKKTWFAGPHVFFNLQLRMLLKARKLELTLIFI
jgi:hypothetical protein